MISSKYITRVTIILTALAICFCFVAMAFSDSLSVITSSGVYTEYEDELFNTEKIISINISMDSEKWEDMLANATAEKYYECDVTVNDTVFYRVGIRPKGNTSLSAVANDPDNNRYSFKLEFDKYVDGQSCFGLDKLVLNNNYADKTNMKEAIVYDMFKYIGADASLYNYAKISVNDEYWGIYLALEAVEESFMLRNYGVENGHLYKPEIMDNGKKNNSDKGKKHSGDGADLNYTNDNTDSYSAIWDGEIIKSNDADRKRVVKALKNVSEKNNLEKYIDVEQVLKYMAVHNFSVNEDSLSGKMAHNYYLYEANGRISILPWDYNLSFGGMNGGNATDTVNDPIDDYYDSTKLFDFVLENEEYKAKYHEYYNKLIEEYYYGGEFEKTYQRIRSQTDELVKNDPNAMYVFDEYVKAAQLLEKVLLLRAQSVKGQLEGTIGASGEQQRANTSALIDASEISLSDMGEFMGGGGHHGGKK